MGYSPWGHKESDTIEQLTHINAVFSKKLAFKIFLKNREKVLVAQPCPTLCNPKDCSLPGSSVHGILQARILEWIALPFFRGSSQPRDWTWVSWILGRFFTIWAIREDFKIRETHIILDCKFLGGLEIVIFVNGFFYCWNKLFHYLWERWIWAIFIHFSSPKLLFIPGDKQFHSLSLDPKCHCGIWQQNS